jgi:anhydro-N-acetylmuramic acid kinase
LNLIDRHNLDRKITSEGAAPMIATVTELTAWAIHHQTRRLSPKELARVLIGGGGRFNKTLMKHLRNYFAGSIVSGTETLGSDPRFVEAECFAWLANLTLAGHAGNLPQVTGAGRPVVLGKISLP